MTMKHPDDNQTIDMMESTFQSIQKGIDGMQAENKRGRKQAPAAERITDTVPSHIVQQASASATAVTLMDEQQDRNIKALALQLSYDGRLEIGAIEDRIRTHMRRTVEECLELGKCLLLLKELSAHGEFTKRLDLFGLHERVARRLMGATLKFSKTDSKSVLMAAGSQTKMLELVVLDDSDIEQIARGESAAGLTLDSIETMSASELRTALRDHKQQLEASRRVSSGYAQQVTDLKEKLERPYQPSEYSASRTEAEKAMLSALQEVMTQTNLQLIRATEVMADMTSRDGISDTAIAAAQNDMKWVAMRVAGVLREFGIEFDIADEIVPSWVREARQQMEARKG